MPCLTGCGSIHRSNANGVEALSPGLIRGIADGHVATVHQLEPSPRVHHPSANCAAPYPPGATPQTLFPEEPRAEGPIQPVRIWAGLTGLGVIGDLSPWQRPGLVWSRGVAPECRNRVCSFPVSFPVSLGFWERWDAQKPQMLGKTHWSRWSGLADDLRFTKPLPISRPCKNTPKNGVSGDSQHAQMSRFALFRCCAVLRARNRRRALTLERLRCLL